MQKNAKKPSFFCDFFGKNSNFSQLFRTITPLSRGVYSRVAKRCQKIKKC